MPNLFVKFFLDDGACLHMYKQRAWQSNEAFHAEVDRIYEELSDERDKLISKGVSDFYSITPVVFYPLKIGR